MGIMEKMFTYISQLAANYRWAWQALLFVFKLLGARGEIIREKFESPILIYTPGCYLTPWVAGSVEESEYQYHGGTVTQESKYKAGKEQRFFVYVKVKNEPKIRGENSTAKNVFSKISFYKLNSDTQLLPEKFGRWQESLQPPQVIDVEKLKYIDIQAGDEKTLDVATRYIIHDDWYAFNTASYTVDHFEQEDNKIVDKDFRVKVEINIEGQEKETRWFIVYNKLIDGKPKIIESNKAKKE